MPVLRAADSFSKDAIDRRHGKEHCRTIGTMF